MAPNPPWADLHQELLTTIANTLTSDPIDILAFRSVCKSWYASAPAAAATSPVLSPPLPLILTPPPESLRERFSGSTKWCLLSATTVYSLRAPSQDPLCGSPVWIAFVDQFNKGKVSFRQPLSDKSYSMPIHFPRNLNLLDFHASELGRFYNVTALYNCYNPIAGNIAKPFAYSGEAVKVVLLSDISVAVTLSHEGKLALLKLGMMGEVRSDQVWEIIHDGKGYRFDDIVEFKGRVLGVDRRGRVYVIGVGNPFTIKMIAPPIAGGGGRRKRLVESLGGLYLVVRCSNVVDKSSEKNAAFKVYELVFKGENGKWRQVTEFGDRVFLFGIGFSLSVATQELGGCCEKNCIIFKDKSFLNYNGINDDNRMFNKLGRHHMLVGVCHMENPSHVGAIGSHCGYSGLFWPPPSWIWPICRLKRLGGIEAAIDKIHMMVPDRLKGKLQEGEDAANHKDLTQWDQNVLAFSVEAQKIKEMVNQMKEFDKDLMTTATDYFEEDASYKRLLNKVQTSDLSTETKNQFVDEMRSSTKKIYDKHIRDEGKLRERATGFNGLLLSLEESTSKTESMHKKFVEHWPLI